MAEPVPVRIPHARPLRFARTVAADDGGAEVECVVPGGSPAADGRAVRPGYLVELAAQAAAAMRGEGAGPVRSGRLVGLAGWSVLAPAVTDVVITVSIRIETDLGELTAFAAELHQGGRLVAAGRLQVHRHVAG